MPASFWGKRALSVATKEQWSYVREMFPDAKWLDALKLPIRLKLAIIAACGTTYVLLWKEMISLGPLDTIISTLLLIAVVVFGIVAIFDGMDFLFQPLAEKRRLTLLAKRRSALQADKQKAREEKRSQVIKQLDRLSRQEIGLLVNVMKGGSPTFYYYVHAPAVTMLQAKYIVWTPGGPHHQDHYPFSISDHVWDELQKRKDEFFEKEEAYKAEEVANKRAGKPNPW